MGQTSTSVKETTTTASERAAKKVADEKAAAEAKKAADRFHRFDDYHTTKLKEGAFKKLGEDRNVQDRLKELFRRSEVGIEQGREEIERSQAQAAAGADTTSKMRQLASAQQGRGMKGMTAASQLAGALTTGMGQMAQFEADLAAKDFAAKQVASEKKAQMQADIFQHDQSQDLKELELRLMKEKHKNEMELLKDQANLNLNLNV